MLSFLGIEEPSISVMWADTNKDNDTELSKLFIEVVSSKSSISLEWAVLTAVSVETQP